MSVMSSSEDVAPAAQARPWMAAYTYTDGFYSRLQEWWLHLLVVWEAGGVVMGGSGLLQRYPDLVWMRSRSLWWWPGRLLTVKVSF